MTMTNDDDLTRLLRATDAAPPLGDVAAHALHARIMADAAPVLALRTVDTAPALTPEREAALEARVRELGGAWLAARASNLQAQPTEAALDQMAQRIAAAAAPTLARYRRPARRSAWVDVAVRWSRPAVPLAMAAGIGALMLVLRTPRTQPVAVIERDVTSMYAALGDDATAVLTVTSPEAAIGGSEGAP